MSLLHRKVAVKVQSLSLLLEMNSLQDDQSLPSELIANISRQIPILDASDSNGNKVINYCLKIEFTRNDWISI